MGFGHEWTFKKAYTPETWTLLEADALMLARALPESLARAHADFKKAHPDLAAAKDEMFKFQKVLGFIQPGFPDGGYAGATSELDARRCIRFGTKLPHQNVCIENTPGAHFAKTGAAPHDLVLIALLCRAEELAPGNVGVGITDGASDYWKETLQWVDKVFERPMPVPKGFSFTQQRNALVLADREARLLDTATPQAPPGKKKSLRA